jgi:hypothetical protein
MLWSLISSAYIIYLYRKLKAEREPEAADASTVDAGGSIGAELDKLNKRLDALEARLVGSKATETAR